MPLTPEAIDRIGELHTAAASPLDSYIGGAAIALPGTMKVHDLEKFMPDRRRFRGKMMTDSIDAFCEYVKDQGAADVFIEADAMRATAFFDMGSIAAPGHCEHTATIKLQRTAPFSSIIRINEEAKTQRELAEWVEDWRRHLSCFDQDSADLHTQKALASIRKMTVETARKLESDQQNMGHKLSAMEQIDVRSDGAQLGGVIFTCKPYTGFQSRDFTMPLSALTGGDNIKLKLRIQEFDAIEEEIAEEFRSKVETALADDDFKIWQGSFEA